MMIEYLRAETLKYLITALDGEKALEIMETLDECGFFSFPASIKYHSNEEGGLCAHSVEVTDALIDLTNKLGLKWQNERSPYIVGLFHDLCKLDDYEWKCADEYGYNNRKKCSGHGEKSVIFAQQLLKLTEEEIACIRWHMGAFDDKENWNYYTRAINQFPNVLYTHTADMIATHINGV